MPSSKGEKTAELSELRAICMLHSKRDKCRDDGLCKKVGDGTTETFGDVVICTVDTLLSSDIYSDKLHRKQHRGDRICIVLLEGLRSTDIFSRLPSSFVINISSFLAVDLLPHT